MGTDFIHGWIVWFQISSCKWCMAYYKFSEIAFHIDPNILQVIQAVVFTSMCFSKSFILDILSPFIYFISQWLLINALVHDILDEHVLLLFKSLNYIQATLEGTGDVLSSYCDWLVAKFPFLRAHSSVVTCICVWRWFFFIPSYNSCIMSFEFGFAMIIHVWYIFHINCFFCFVLQLKCGNCGELTAKEAWLSLNETVPLPGGRGTAHVVQKVIYSLSLFNMY